MPRSESASRGATLAPDAHERVIAHVDMDAFYPSVEVKEDPSLKGRPVIVGADPKDGEGRGVVASCSYEARRLGLHSAQPISIAFQKCPHGVYLRPDFDTYRRVSERVMRILRSYADEFQPVGIDEAYLDVTSEVGGFPQARDLAQEVKDSVREEECLSCSVGVAPNKPTAKIAAGRQKPDGLVVVPPDKVEEFLYPLPVEEIGGVGEKTRERLEALGVSTIGELATSSLDRLRRHLGKRANRLWLMANGRYRSDVRRRDEAKSVGAEHTFEEDVGDLNMVYDELDRLAERVEGRLESADLAYRTVGIKVRMEDFETFVREKSLTHVTSDPEHISKQSRRLFREFEGDGRRVRLVGVRVSNLEEKMEEQKPLHRWA